MAKEYKDLVVGLDIGTAKVMVVVAEVIPGGKLDLAMQLILTPMIKRMVGNAQRSQ